MSDTLQGAESDDESNSHEYYAHPYSQSYGFATTSWQLRKNLTETFNQHVVDKKIAARSVQQNNAAAGTIAKNNSDSFVNEKIAAYEQKMGNNNPPAMGKPPRQPSSSHPTTNSEPKSKFQDKRGVSVYLRIRPPTAGLANTIEIIPDEPPTKVRTHAPGKSNAAKVNRERSFGSQEPPTAVREFDFKEVFGPEQQNEDVYSKVVAPMVARMFPYKGPHGKGTGKESESGLLFAYGATNAGKTYSIMGKAPTYQRDGTMVDQKHLGIVPRAISDLMGKIKDRNHKESLFLSYFEIYQDQIFDCFDGTNTRNPGFKREALRLRETKNKNTIIRGLRQKEIESIEGGMSLVRQANSKRTSKSNSLNTESSRSHCICQLQIVPRHGGPTIQKASTSNGYNTEEEETLTSKQKAISLWIVDLAGSERSKRTNVGSARQREAGSINKSLMHLFSIIRSLRTLQDTAGSSQIIPFRETKLTHLFMPIFTGRRASSISMIVNANPNPADFDETNHVLSYASQARLVQITEKDASTKSTQASGEYGYNGRPIQKSSVTSKLAKLVRKLSPKKGKNRDISRKDEKKKGLEPIDARKRKAPPQPALSRGASFSSTTSGGTSSGLPLAKKMRAMKPALKSSATNSQRLKPSSSTDAEMKSLKLALSTAQSEIEFLKTEQAKADEAAAQLEAKIRLEVSEEMEEQLESTKRHYVSIIDTMKQSSRQSLGIFEKRARQDKAEAKVADLIFKVEECEEEMKRQSQEHSTQLEALKQEHKQEIAAYKIEIQKLQATSKSENLTTAEENENSDDTGIVQAQRRRIAEQEMELEVLKKSKTELIAAYEALLAGDEEITESEEDESMEASPEKCGSRYRTRSQQKRDKKTCRT